MSPEASKPVIELLLYSIVVVASLVLFARTARMRLTVLRAAKSTRRVDNPPARIMGVVVHVFGQGRLLHGDLRAGLMHFFIFWGFVVLLFNSVQFVINGFVPSGEIELPLLGRHQLLGGPYLFVRDLFTLLVLAAVLYALWRRLVTKPRRLTLSHEGLLILGLIATLMVTDLAMGGAGLALGRIESHGWAIGENLVAPLFAGLGSTANSWSFGIAKWANVFAFFTFLNLLPLSKHFHVLLSPFNVYFRDLGAFAKPRRIDFETEEEFGVDRIEKFHWKNWLDAYNCTECGRCDSFCPANQTGKVLSPQHIITGTREQIYRLTPRIIAQIAVANNAAKGSGGASAADSNGAAGSGGAPPLPASGDAVLAEDFPLLVGGVHVDEALWACTTCGACDTHCPVFIEHVNPIMEMRRHLVMEQEGRFPQELQTMFRGLESQGNPWGLGAHTRMDWAAGLDVPTLEENPDAEYLYFVGCFGSFDAKSKPTSVAMIELLHKAGVNFAVLGKSEMCNGDPARRSGHEYLANAMAEQLLEQFREMAPKKLITQCPHCFNAFKNDYPDFGFTFGEVLHHSELLSRLVNEGRLKPSYELAALGGMKQKHKIVFHDSCYLGRYNEIYEEPRETLKAVPGVELVEAKPCKDKGFCCGAGGGRMFMEENVGRRVNEFRYEQLAASGADEVAVSCPFCMTMIDDAAKAAGEKPLPVRDIALVLRDAVIGIPV